MSDGIVREKSAISSTAYLYGCEADELPVSREDRIAMHEEQEGRAKALAEKIYDRIAVLRKRLTKVHEAQNWNALMADNLRKGK